MADMAKQKQAKSDGQRRYQRGSRRSNIQSMLVKVWWCGRISVLGSSSSMKTGQTQVRRAPFQKARILHLWSLPFGSKFYLSLSSTANQAVVSEQFNACVWAYGRQHQIPSCTKNRFSHLWPTPDLTYLQVFDHPESENDRFTQNPENAKITILLLNRSLMNFLNKLWQTNKFDCSIVWRHVINKNQNKKVSNEERFAKISKEAYSCVSCVQPLTINLSAKKDGYGYFVSFNR